MKSVPKYSQVISKTIHKCYLTNLGEVLFMNLQFIYIYMYILIYIHIRIYKLQAISAVIYTLLLYKEKSEKIILHREKV